MHYNALFYMQKTNRTLCLKSSLLFDITLHRYLHIFHWFHNDAIFIVQGLQGLCNMSKYHNVCSVNVCRYLSMVLCCSYLVSTPACDEHRGAGRSCVEVTRPVLCCAVCWDCVLLLSKQNGVQEFQYIVQYNWSRQCGYSFQWIFWAWLWNTWSKALTFDKQITVKFLIIW